jgi:hypothetical protein
MGSGIEPDRQTTKELSDESKEFFQSIAETESIYI